MATWIFLRLQFARYPGKYAGIGPSRAAVLDAIVKYGSITAAAESVGLTYRQVWSAVQDMNKELGEIVVVKRGRHSGGASLTPLGEKLLKRYRKIEREFYQVFSKDLRYMERLVGDDAKRPQNIPRWAQIMEPKSLNEGPKPRSSVKKPGAQSATKRPRKRRASTLVEKRGR